VLVGNATCKVNSLDAWTLYCSPPPAPPPPSGSRRRHLPTVTVRAAAFLLFTSLDTLCHVAQTHFLAVTSLTSCTQIIHSRVP